MRSWFWGKGFKGTHVGSLSSFLWALDTWEFHFFDDFFDGWWKLLKAPCIVLFCWSLEDNLSRALSFLFLSSYRSKYTLMHDYCLCCWLPRNTSRPFLRQFLVPFILTSNLTSLNLPVKIPPFPLPFRPRPWPLFPRKRLPKHILKRDLIRRHPSEPGLLLRLDSKQRH